MSETIATTVADSPPGSLVQGRALLFLRAFWCFVAIVTLYLVITGVPLRYEKVYTVAPALRVHEYRDLIFAGVSPKVAAVADAVSGTTLFVVMFVPSVLLFARGSSSREVIFTSLTLILYGATSSGIASVHRSVGPPFSQSAIGLLATSYFFLQTSTVWIALFWLPEGRFHTRVAAWFTGLLILFGGGVYLFADYPRSHDLVNLAGLVITPLGVWSQTHHYRTVSNPVTRQQIKWAFVGIVIAAVGFLISQSAIVTIGDRAGLTPRIAMVVARLVQVVANMALPVCFAIAIVRYRLWRIDLVINRSLVYGVTRPVGATRSRSGGATSPSEGAGTSTRSRKCSWPSWPWTPTTCMMPVTKMTVAARPIARRFMFVSTASYVLSEARTNHLLRASRTDPRTVTAARSLRLDRPVHLYTAL